MDQARGRIFIISGPSGVGKDYTANELSKLDGYEELDLCQPISYTTRPRRSSDPVDSIYRFLSEEEFASLVHEDMIEFSERHGHMYGTSKKGFEEMIEAGHNVLKILDKNGARAFKEMYPDNATTIYLKPPSVDALVMRLKGRESETPEEYNRRMADNLRDLRDLSDFDYVVTAGRDGSATARIVLLIMQENIAGNV